MGCTSVLASGHFAEKAILSLPVWADYGVHKCIGFWAFCRKSDFVVAGLGRLWGAQVYWPLGRLAQGRYILGTLYDAQLALSVKNAC